MAKFFLWGRTRELGVEEFSVSSECEHLEMLDLQLAVFVAVSSVEIGMMLLSVASTLFYFTQNVDLTWMVRGLISAPI